MEAIGPVIVLSIAQILRWSRRIASTDPEINARRFHEDLSSVSAAKLAPAGSLHCATSEDGIDGAVWS